MTLFRNRVRLLAGRLNCLSPSEIKSSRPANDAGLEHKMRQPGVSLRAILNRAANSAALLREGTVNLDICSTLRLRHAAWISKNTGSLPLYREKQHAASLPQSCATIA
ncbi:MAG: hypothetical protein DMG61_24900 [Acidobacteria bacterium]|nr:MAG: hypothetical protein DMG61_24900 [Acidobacteriota bacterium]